MPMNNWNTFSQMYNYAKELHAFWSGVVPGTVHSPNNIIATLEFIKDFEAGDQFEYLKEGMRLSLENGVRDWEEFREKAKKDGLTLKEKSFQRDVDICNHYLSILRN